ncbi:MAG TPA: IS21-like element helper ATPase IstB [Methylomirabilota bacterium]|nr:IS21-like element helper ATPase IstB [Methylomirabilota bacterium]
MATVKRTFCSGVWGTSYFGDLQTSITGADNDTGAVIEQAAHVAGLVAATRQANPSTARDRLRLAARGESLRFHVARLLALLDDYGPHELAAAIDRALERDALGVGASAHILETRRRQRGLKPPMPLALPDHPGVRDLDVTPLAWRPTMTSPDPIPTTLSDQLRQLGLVHTASELNDFIARATQKRWSPVVQLERLVQAELEARLRQRVERRLNDAHLGRVKSMAGWEWAWPKGINRPTVERVLTLDFLAQPENVILVASHGLGKTMIAKYLVHDAILAGHSARFLTAADLILDLTRQETARALQHRLQSYLRPTLLAIDEVGYLAYDAHAADLLFQVVSRRYEQKSIVITTNLPFKQWDMVFPNAACAVALIDRLTHHAEIISIDGESYRKQEAEQAQKRKQEQKPKR